MSLRDAVFSRRIIRRAINRADRSLAGHAALKLPTDFLSAAMFEWISAAASDQRERTNDRRGFHLLMLRSDWKNARRVEAMQG
jgi:hypothetical protein